MTPDGIDTVVPLRILTHKETGLLLAVSDEMPGLYVHGRTDREIAERAPQAIHAILEANGAHTIGSRRMPLPPGWWMAPSVLLGAAAWFALWLWLGRMLWGAP